MERVDIVFNDLNRGLWITKIVDTYNSIVAGKQVFLSFDESMDPDYFEPVHLVTLANLIQHLFNNQCAVFIGKKNEKVYKYLMDKLQFQKYWIGNNHVSANDENIINLWRIVEAEADLYARNVENYFKSTFFKNKDLSSVSNSIVEAYYNVFDHADARDNAFSFVMFDKQSKKLYVAISDFGVGVPNNFRKIDSSYTDEESLSLAIRQNVTTHSTSKNRGWGLHNIFEASCEARLYSGMAFVVKKDELTKTYNVGWKFPGTLLYFVIDLNLAEESEVIEFEF